MPALGQHQKKLEQTERLLKQAKKTDTLYVDNLNKLSNEYAISGAKDPLPLARKALYLSDSLHYLRGQGIANLNLAIIYDTRGSYHQALEHYLISLRQLRQVNDEDHLSQLLQNLGYFYSAQGNYRKAIEVTKQAADLTFKNHGELGSSYCWNNLGYYYTEAAAYDSALFFTFRAYEALKTAKDTVGLADVFYNLGNIAWKADGNATKALDYCLQALDYYVKPPFEAEAYIGCKAFVGFLYLQLDNHSLADRYLQESLADARKNQYRFLMKNIYRWQADLYADMGVWDKAYDTHKRFFQLHDSIFSEHSANRVEQYKAEYELETREAKIELLKNSKIIQEDELERQMLYRNSFMALFALFLLITGVLYKSNTVKNRTNKVLTEQKREIEEKNKAILQQNLLLEEQQKAIASQAQNLNRANHQINRQRQAIEQTAQDLSSSLNYASRIQHAMMPRPAELKAALPDSFIWLNSKDVVSGDFYWFTQLGHKIYLAAVDCTGHGVPGAFLSLIGDVYLNQAILQEKIQDAGQILSYLHEQVRRALNQEVSYSQDGMEVGLCVIDLKGREVTFAGARNSLYYCQGGEVHKVSGERMYIGGLNRNSFSGFTTHKLKIEEPASFYLSTDGVRDQFGGEQDKKFGEKRLLELIARVNGLPMEQQKEQFREQMIMWMRGYEQTDDMMLIGWRL